MKKKKIVSSMRESLIFKSSKKRTDVRQRFSDKCVILSFLQFINFHLIHLHKYIGYITNQFLLGLNAWYDRHSLES